MVAITMMRVIPIDMIVGTTMVVAVMKVVSVPVPMSVPILTVNYASVVVPMRIPMRILMNYCSSDQTRLAIMNH